MKRTNYRYRAKRDCYFSMRYFKKGDEAQFDIGMTGEVPHHFEPLDGGPIGASPKHSIFRRSDARIAAREKKAEDSREPETFHEIATTRSARVAEPDNTPVLTKLPSTPEGDNAFDIAMDYDKPTVLAMAKRDGKSTHGNKATIVRRLLGLNVD